jgi:hypothetical protein
MSRQAYFHDVEVPAQREKPTNRRRIPILVVGLTALVLVVLAVLVVTLADKPTTMSREGVSPSVTDVELMIARRYTFPAEAESRLLAVNPGLAMARRAISAEAESSFLAANPELMVARRYPASAEAESNFLSANPELIIARRFWSP